MTAGEWPLWLARASIQPLGWRRVELAVARLGAWLLLPHMKKGQAVQPHEIVPDWWEEKPERGSAADLKAKAMQLARMMPAREGPVPPL